MIISENELNSQNLQEFEGLLQEFVKLSPSNILEIGSLYGWTLQHFIHYSKPESTVLSIDLPVRYFVGPQDWRVEKQENNYKNVWPKWAKKNKTKLYLIADSSQNLSNFTKAKEIFDNQQIDFLFIDGNHTYEGVKTDYKLYGSMVKPGGIIALHDIGINEEGGVHILWDEIKNNHNGYKELLFDTNQEKGIGIIYV